MLRADALERRADVRIAQVGQAVANRPAGGDGGEALLRVASVLPDVACYEGVDGGAVVVVEVAAADEVVGQGTALVPRPRLEGGHELDLVDQPVLQREQAEEQVAIGGHGASSSAVEPARRTIIPRRGGPWPGHESNASYYRMPDQRSTSQLRQIARPPPANLSATPACRCVSSGSS